MQRLLAHVNSALPDLRGDTTSHRWILLTWGQSHITFLRCPEHAARQTVEQVVIVDAMSIVRRQYIGTCDLSIFRPNIMLEWLSRDWNHSTIPSNVVETNTSPQGWRTTEELSRGNIEITDHISWSFLNLWPDHFCWNMLSYSGLPTRLHCPHTWANSLCSAQWSSNGYVIRCNQLGR